LVSRRTSFDSYGKLIQVHPSQVFAEALKAWQNHCLPNAAFRPDCVWIFDENLCFERDPARAGEFQARIPDTVHSPRLTRRRLLNEHFCGIASRLVFYRIGNVARGIRLSGALRPWFEPKGESGRLHPEG